MAMTLRLTEAETEALRRTAEREGVSMQDVARKAIREYVVGWERTRDEFLAEFVVKNANLLERLGE
jgi:predicted transcriptional regulator